MLTHVDPNAWTHRYSPENVARIQHTRPDASAVATYRQWRDLGRQVRQGERGIRINLGRQRTCSVFDISQTDPMRQCTCGTYTDRADRFCGECGHQLTDQEKAPVPFTLHVSPKALASELKPICAAIRKQVSATKRRDMPLMGAIRLQADENSWTAAYFLDEDCFLGKFPNAEKKLDVLLDFDNAYALATILDPKKPVTLSVETAAIASDFPPAWKQPTPRAGTYLTVTQPSDSAGRTDTMRFKVLEV